MTAEPGAPTGMEPPPARSDGLGIPMPSPALLVGSHSRPATTGEDPSRPGNGPLRRVLAFLKRHPVVCLLLLSPGIPEYLSSSSSLTGLFISPAAFLLFLGLNLGLYGPGVLLIREAAIRWNKGWATILLLGAAYAILEEGIALSTFFNAYAPPVGGLGFYGHWLGVSWVWASALTLFHAVFSIFLPILLLGLALPETRGRPLLSRPEISATCFVLGLDVVVLIALVRFAEHFWLGVPLLIGSLGAIAVLIVGARAAPRDLLTPGSLGPTASPWWLWLVGALLFPVTILSEAVAAAAHASPVLAVAAVALTFALFLGASLHLLGSVGRERGEVALALGCLVPVMLFGFLAALPAPVVLGADFVVVLFFRKLWRMYPGAVPASTSGEPSMTGGRAEPVN